MAGRLITMSAKELDRLEVIRRVAEAQLTQVKAGELLGLTSRQVRRLCRALEAGGPGGLVSRKRGRPSNRKLSAELQSTSARRRGSRLRCRGVVLSLPEARQQFDLRILLTAFSFPDLLSPAEFEKAASASSSGAR